MSLHSTALQNDVLDWCTSEITISPANSSISTSLNVTTDDVLQSYCALVFHYTIPNTYIRIWDLVLLLINLFQVLFLIIVFFTKCKKLRKSMALFPILFVLVVLISTSVMASNITCMIRSYDSIPYKVLRLWLRFVIFVTEISVIVFGMFFKRYKGKKVCLGVTLFIIIIFAGLYTVGEGLSEFLVDHSSLPCDSLNFFTSGGMLFLFCSSLCLSVGYFTAYFVYYVKCYKRFNLPSKKSFYRYCLFLSCINLIQAIASMLWYEGAVHQVVGEIGICLIALTQLTYQTTFAPMIFWIFLSRFFRTSPQYKRFDQKKKTDTRRSVSDDDSLTVKMDKRRTTSQSSNLPYGTPYQTSHISPSPQASPRSSPVPSSIDQSIRSRSFENSFY